MHVDLFADGDDFSWATIVKGRNAFYQKQMADQVLQQADETTSLLTDALKTHLNIGQNFTTNSAATSLTLGKVSMAALNNRLLSQAGSGQVRLPSTLHSNQTSTAAVSFRVCCPLAVVIDGYV
jgi:hypothetical protein